MEVYMCVWGGGLFHLFSLPALSKAVLHNEIVGQKLGVLYLTYIKYKR